jgi:hypothetical protein
MKKVIVTILIVLLLAPFAFANGQGETTTTVAGEAVIGENADGTPTLAVRTRDGELVQVEMKSEELAQLQVRNQEQIAVKGVFIGKTAENQVQSRVFARSVVMNGTEVALQTPIQLTKRDREQLRTYEGSLTQTRTKDQTRLGNDGSSGSGSGGSTGGDSGGGSSGGGNSGGGSGGRPGK